MSHTDVQWVVGHKGLELRAGVSARNNWESYQHAVVLKAMRVDEFAMRE